MEPQNIVMISNKMMPATAACHASPETTTLALVDLVSPINLDDLARLTPQLTWNQVFHTIDALSRQGKISLRRRNHGYDLMNFSALAHH